MGPKNTPQNPDSVDTIGCAKDGEDSTCDTDVTSATEYSSDDPTDGRKRFEWESCYPDKVRLEINYEGIYLFLLLALSLSFIFLTWNDAFVKWLSLSPLQSPVFKKYAYYSMSGLLGGVIFDFKNFYKSVARGWWHQDRRIWRVVSPFIALAIGFVVGAMVESSLISATSPITNPTIIAIGFLSGYFADRAIGKMREIAAVIFGKSAASSNDGK